MKNLCIKEQDNSSMEKEQVNVQISDYRIDTRWYCITILVKICKFSRISPKEN